MESPEDAMYEHRDVYFSSAKMETETTTKAKFETRQLQLTWKEQTRVEV